jgi:hypothetical protein
MTRHLPILTLALLSVAIPLRAANGPNAGTDTPNLSVWTNDDMEKLHQIPGLICIVGPVAEETSKQDSRPQPYAESQDPRRYAQQAAELRKELERSQAQLEEYSQAIQNARNLKKTAGGVNLDDDEVAITPEVGIEILQQRLDESQTELAALEDLARRNDIPPGTLRGQEIE